MSELAISIAVNVLLGLVLLGLLRWKRIGDTERLAGAAEAIELFSRRLPMTAGGATVSHDGRSALLDLGSDGCVGLLQRHGRRWNARTLVPGEVSSAELRQEAIKLKFADFAWPHAQIRIDDPDARARWLHRLQALRSPHA
jgi:hypothetical protein